MTTKAPSGGASTQKTRGILPRVSGLLRQEAGLGILEVLIGGVVLAIAIVGIALMFSEGQSYAVADGDDRVAVALAQQKIEHVRSLGFACIPAPIASSPANLPVAVVTGCPDTLGLDGTQEARKFNETAPAPTLLGRYTSRVTTVTCVDPVTFQRPGVACDSPSAKVVQVDITPIMAKARGTRVETVLTAH